MKHAQADILRQYGPFPGVDDVAGVSFDGKQVWFASGDRLVAFDPESGDVVATLPVIADAGTAFDGTHLFQIAEAVIRKIDPATGEVLGEIATPGEGGASGLAWAEGSLWVGKHRGRKIHQVDPETGAVLRTIDSDRFVTGVSWVDGELWHGTWQDEQSDVRRVDPETGAVLECLQMPRGVCVSGLESDGRERFFLWRRTRWPGQGDPPDRGWQHKLTGLVGRLPGDQPKPESRENANRLSRRLTAKPQLLAPQESREAIALDPPGWNGHLVLPDMQTSSDGHT